MLLLLWQLYRLFRVSFDHSCVLKYIGLYDEDIQVIGLFLSTLETTVSMQSKSSNYTANCMIKLLESVSFYLRAGG